jgi:hypothetical protein
VPVGDHQTHATKAPFDQAAKEPHPETVVLARAGVGPEHGSVTRLGDPDRNDRGHRDYPARLTDLVERGVQPHVRMLALDRPDAECLHVLVQDLADPG